MVWGNDREITTYDNAGGCYLGPVSGHNNVSVSGIGIALSNECLGGAIVILNGSGTGQIRRVTRSSTIEGNAVFFMDKPFVAPPTSMISWMMVMPFRGRTLMLGNTYKDVGAVQFYGIGLDHVVAECEGERMGGFLSWGQWRSVTTYMRVDL